MMHPTCVLIKAFQLMTNPGSGKSVQVPDLRNWGGMIDSR